MKEIMEQVESILKTEAPDRHSFFQLKHFLLEAEPTTQAKLQACIRELKSRRTTLENISLEIDDLKDQNALLALQLEDFAEEPETDFDRREAEINKRILRRRMQKNDRQQVELHRKGRNLLEECQFFVEAFLQLQAVEPVKPWDDLDVQQEYWDAKIGNMLRMRAVLSQPLDEELVKAALALNDGSKAKAMTLALIDAQQQFAEKHGLPLPEAEVTLKE